MSYEKLEQQGRGSREAVKFLPKNMQDDLVSRQGETEVEKYPMESVSPSTESNWKEGAKLKKKAIHSTDLTHQDLMSRLRSAQITAVQGDITSEFGDAATNAIYAKAGVAAISSLITGKPPAQQEQERQQQAEAKKKQVPMMLIGGGLILVLLSYILFIK